MAARIFAPIGAGWAGAFAYNNTDTVWGFTSEIGKAVARSMAGGGRGYSSTPSSTGEIGVLTDQVERLSRDVQALVSGGGSRGVTVVTGNGGESRSYLLVPVALVGGYLVYMRVVHGVRACDYMYVTRRSFRQGLASVGNTMAQISSAVAKVRQQLTERLEALSVKVEEGLDVQTEMRKELGDVSISLETVGQEVTDINAKLDGLSEKQDFANKGIFLLCNVVSEAMGGSAPSMPELCDFAKQIAPPDSQAPKAKIVINDIDDEVSKVQRSISDGNVTKIYSQEPQVKDLSSFTSVTDQLKYIKNLATNNLK